MKKGLQQRMKSWLVATLSIVALCGASMDASAQSVEVVYDDGTNNYTGTYGDYGEWDGKPSYNYPVDGGNAVIEWSSADSKWIFYHDKDYVTINSNDANTADVPQNGWVAEGSFDVAIFSGTGTVDNNNDPDPYEGTVVTVANLTNADLNGDYSYVNTNSQEKPVYAKSTIDFGDVTIEYGDVKNEGDFLWEIKYQGMTGFTVLYTNPFGDVVPQNGWTSYSAYGDLTLSGDGSENNATPVVEVSLSNDIMLKGGIYTYNGEVNGKSSYIMAGDGTYNLFIEWSDSDWDQIFKWEYKIVTEDMGGGIGTAATTVLYDNAFDTPLVPQNGWTSYSTYGDLALSGNGTVNNVVTTIGDELTSVDVSIYPNPAIDNVTVSVDEQGMLVIYNATGSTAYSTPLNSGRNSVDVSSLSAGVYFFAVSVNGAEEVTKVIKK